MVILSMDSHELEAVRINIRSYLLISNSESHSKIATLRLNFMRGTGFEPANTYVTGPSTLRL